MKSHLVIETNEYDAEKAARKWSKRGPSHLFLFKYVKEDREVLLDHYWLELYKGDELEMVLKYTKSYPSGAWEERDHERYVQLCKNALETAERRLKGAEKSLEDYKKKH